jgi:hypothetical protein
MSPCEHCARHQGMTQACDYCMDFMGRVSTPIRKINIASGEDASINMVNYDYSTTTETAQALAG